MKYLILIPLIVFLASCQTEATSSRFSAAEQHSFECKDKVLAVRERIAIAKANHVKPQVMFKDERNAMMYLTIEKMADMNATVVTALLTKNNDLTGCAAEFIAMTNADAQKTAGINRLVNTGVGWGLGIIGLKVIADGFGPDAYQNPASSSGDTWNVSGSRVNSNSGNSSGSGSANASSSGDGLGLSNTFSTGSGQSVGGFEPRTTNANGSLTDVNTGSSSGENSGVAAPVEVQPLPEE